MKARKKPIDVEVHQFFADSAMWPAGVYKSVTGHFIDTLEGQMSVKDRSFIVTGPGGEKWAIREDVFLDTYEVIEEPPICAEPRFFGA